MHLDETTYSKQLERVLSELSRLPLHRLDDDAGLLNEAFCIACDAGLFAFHRYDTSVHERLKFALFSRLTPFAGSLAFLGVQILAANKLMQSNAFALQDRYFNRRCGIAINHLRAPATVVSAEEVPGGYRLTGRLSWASGLGIFDTLLIGFHHQDRELMAVVPFVEQEGFAIGEPDETFVGNAMRTVDISLEDYFVPAEQVVSTHPTGTFTRARSVSKTIHYALYGLGLGAVDGLSDDALKEAAANRLESCKEAFMHAADGETAERLRVELFLLVQQIVTTGMVLHGGKSILNSERLQRYYRELIMFNANGLNTPIKQHFKTAFLHSGEKSR